VPILDELKMLLKVIILGGIGIGTVAFILKFNDLSRSFILIFLALNILTLMLARLSVRLLSHYVRRKGYNVKRVLIVGTNAYGANILKIIKENDMWGLRVSGFIATDGLRPGGHFKSYYVIGGLDDLEGIVSAAVVDEVIFAMPMPKMKFDEMEDTLLMLEDHGIRTRLLCDFFPNVTANVYMENMGTMPLITYSTTPNDSLSLAFKRGLDLLGSVMLFILLLPVMLVTAIAIKLSSKGPVFFSQKRAGRNGRTFTLYKFRSMVDGAELKKDELLKLNELDGPIFKIKNDPRTTGLGRFLRRSSIDELPQLWNVLIGDMSIVGPRPHPVEEVANYKRWQKRRLSMRPGLTCLWQVRGRSKIADFDECVRLDLQYIDRWSLGLDLKIFLRTIPTVILGRGAM
jgi:exopolysaccharide biosynthesis polyprenyl glycosylphosphotransferase